LHADVLHIYKVENRDEGPWKKELSAKPDPEPKFELLHKLRTPSLKSHQLSFFSFFIIEPSITYKDRPNWISNCKREEGLDKCEEKVLEIREILCTDLTLWLVYFIQRQCHLCFSIHKPIINLILVILNQREGREVEKRIVQRIEEMPKVVGIVEGGVAEVEQHLHRIDHSPEWLKGWSKDHDRCEDEDEVGSEEVLLGSFHDFLDDPARRTVPIMHRDALHEFCHDRSKIVTHKASVKVNLKMLLLVSKQSDLSKVQVHDCITEPTCFRVKNVFRQWTKNLNSNQFLNVLSPFHLLIK
jgi:hypothetical protein